MPCLTLSDYAEELKLLLILAGLVTGAYVGVWYLYSAHPQSRSIVRLRSEDIITVNGVSEDGWLTECNTGTHRHVVGDFKVIDGYTPPIVCVNERGYDEWLKQAEANKARAQ